MDYVGLILLSPVLSNTEKRIKKGCFAYKGRLLELNEEQFRSRLV